MTYQGERARPAADEERRYFEVSAVRLDPLGWPTEVLWAEISTKSNLDVYAPVIVPVADVVDDAYRSWRRFGLERSRWDWS